MKPLVYYCRWQGASLRLRGRDEAAVWGQLVFTDDAGLEKTQDFRYELAASQLILFADGEKRVLVLDDMGVPVDES